MSRTGQPMPFGEEPTEVSVELAFIERVNSRWATLIRNHVGVEISTVGSRRTADHLSLEIRTENATAQITAREALRTLEITVSRFKDQRTLCAGACNTDIDLDRKLRALLIDLSA
jgi:hypothetical protein